MEAISKVGSIQTQQIPEVQRAERVANVSEGQGKAQEGADLSVNDAPVQAQKQEVQAEVKNSNVPTRQERTEEMIEADNKRVMEAISEMNKKMFNNSEAVFGIHEDTNRITIKIVDKTTKKTIKELPPEKTLDMIAKAWELAGLMVDERG
ncbi:MAG: flagellar protein FlaG [Butyrivibrio sp.]|nr:flagellar protein FlaG [Butyrivibrio sp.]